MSITDGLSLGSGEIGLGKRKKVKVEGAASLSWVDPLYAEQIPLCWNRVDPIPRGAFEKAYDLNNQGIPPKQLKFGVHLEESEVEALFGQRVGKNGYCYSYLEDTEFVKRVERLWMITHQRAQVPNTRLINLAEAKGLVYENKKGKKVVTWCVHAEWTCRDQLRRINQEKDATNKIGEKIVVEVSGDERDEEEGAVAAGIGQRGLASLEFRTLTAIGLQLHVDVRVMAIGQWQEYLSLLERETPTLDALVSRLTREKDVARMELVRVSSQVQYGQTLLSNSLSKLLALQQAREKCDVKLAALKSAEPQSKVEIDAASADLLDVLKKLEAQQGFIEQLEDSFGLRSVDEEVTARLSKDAEALWSSAVKKLSLWKLHRVALSEQLKGMKTGYQRPTLHPSPLPFLYVNCETVDVQVVGLEIVACPFCTRGFDPAWDCRLSSCCHAYHTWCAYTHFSRESKCMFEGCNQEPHEDWWVMAGIPKPQGENVEPPVESWDLCKSVNVGAPVHGQSSRSLSTNDNRPTPADAQSPSIGSFQVFSQQLQLTTNPRLTLLTQTNKRGQVDGHDNGMDVGGHHSPKRKKVPLKNADLQSIEEQVFLARSIANSKKNHGNGSTVAEERGIEAADGRVSTHENGNNQCSKGESNDTGTAKGSRSPKHRRRVVAEVRVDKPSPKRERGVQKIMPVEDIQGTPRDSNKMDEFEDGSDEEGTGSDSARDEGGDEGDHHSEMNPGEDEEKSPAATKNFGKKGRLGRGGKKPVAKRVSVSRVTRAAKGATPK